MPVFNRQLGKVEKLAPQEAVKSMADHLRSVQEQLEYTLANLGEENFNETSLTDIGETIAAPIVEQSLTSITLEVTDPEGENESTIKLWANGAVISSASINLSGFVTFTSLEGSGTTMINGDNIKTGTISAIDIEGCNIVGSVFQSVLDSYGGVGGEIKMCYLDESLVAGGMFLEDQGAGTSDESRYRMFIYTKKVLNTPFAMKLQSAAGLSASATTVLALVGGTRINLTAPEININGTLNINGTKYGG